MKKLIVMLMSLLFVELASGTSTCNSDSLKIVLLRQLSQTPQNDVKRLDILYQIRLVIDNPKVETYYINRLLEEAEIMKNPLYICKAYLAFMSIAYNNYDPKEVERWMKLLEPIARKEKLYDELFLGRRCVVDMRQVTEEYEREEREANELLLEAEKLDNKIGIAVGYQCLSNVYRITYRQQKAVEALKKGYEVIEGVNETFAIEISNSLIATYAEMNDSTNWLRWIRTQDNYLRQIIKQDPHATSRLKRWLMVTYTSYLSYYIQVNKLQQAEKYLRLAEQYNIEGYGTFSYKYHQARYIYFKKTGCMDKALFELDCLINLFKNISSTTYSTLIFQKANVLHDLNREDEALALYKRSNLIKDSVNITILKKQVEQLMKDYNTNQVLLEKTKIEQNTQLTFLILIVIIILILLVFITHTYRVHKHLKSSEEEMRRMAEDMEQSNVAKDLFLSAISTAIEAPMTQVVDGSMALASGKMIDVDERKKLSEMIDRTSKKLMSLINNILDLSRLEAGMMKYREQYIDMLFVIRSQIEALPVEVQRRITLSFPKETSLCAQIDIIRLQEVFSNLILMSSDELFITIEFVEDKKQMQVFVKGSIFSSEQNDQDVDIANEVNRLLVVHFGGHYEVKTNDESLEIYFVIPLGDEKLQ